MAFQPMVVNKKQHHRQIKVIRRQLAYRHKLSMTTI